MIPGNPVRNIHATGQLNPWRQHTTQTPTKVLLGQNLISCTHYEPDCDALRAASTRVVLAAGVESEGELASRAAHAVAEKLGTSVVSFPSHHGGFISTNDCGMAGEPEAFAASLRQVLSE